MYLRLVGNIKRFYRGKGRDMPNRTKKFAALASLGHGLIVCVLGLTAAACRTGTQPEVVVYTALDQEFSEPVLERFRHQTGIRVRAVYDIESTKTVGLYQRIVREREQPLCDVFWNNEIMHTVQLEEQGLLASYRPGEAERFPAQFVSPDGYWAGFAGRARVLLVNRQVLGGEPPPQSIRELADPRWKGRAGLARPLFGTTATHAAVLFDVWGEEEATQFFERVARQAAIYSGNKQVALDVSAGRIAFGLTDTDDAAMEIARGAPVYIVWPDQGPGELGTLLIPNTVALIKGARNPDHARRLIEFLLSASVESLLAQAASRQIPLGSNVTAGPDLVGVQDVRWMEVDFRQAARLWPRAAAKLQELFP